MSTSERAGSAGERKWIWDRQTGEHFLTVTDDESWKAYKTPGGDYALTLHSDAAGHGGEVEYFPNLKAAKHEAEKRVRESGK